MPTTRLSKRLPWVTLSPGMAGVTPTTLTLQVCSYNALTDVPTVVFDLNDKATTFIYGAGTFKMPQPEKVWVRSSNIRTPGEKISKFQYKNRHISCSIWIRGASTNAIQNTVHALIAAIEQPPYVLQIRQPGSTTVSWADVVAVKHNVPPDPVAILGGAQTHIEIDFECRPGLRGNRITLSNLVTNPGFEAPSGPGVQVFSDSFANVNAYGVAPGGAPTLAANVMTIPNGGRVAFGSPAWGALNTWQIRFQFATGLLWSFYLHYTDGNNWLQVQGSGSLFQINHSVAGTIHNLVQSAPTLTNGTWYWLQVTQFPTASGTPPYVTAALFNDTGPGSIGTAVTNGSIAAAAFDGVTALSGRPQIAASGAALAIGGAFANVQTVSLFGPGGWQFSGTNGTTGQCSAAWEQNAANTYPGGPVQSFGAARVDMAPAGTVNVAWRSGDESSAARVQQTAIPVAAPGHVLPLLAWVKSANVGANCQQGLQVNEYNSSGAFLRASALLVPVTGPQAAWTQLSTTYTTGGDCAYVVLKCTVVDTNAGQSANGIVWIDNVQVWNQTTTGAAPGAMPYCELRFPNSPAQLLVSGLVGDMETPAHVALATYQSSFVPGASLTYFLGRKRLPAAGWRSASAFVGQFSTAAVTPMLDSASYSGYYHSIPAMGGWNGIALTGHPADLAGAYHQYTRVRTNQVFAKLGKVVLNVFTIEDKNPYQGFPNTPDGLAAFQGATVAPFAAANTWTLADNGALTVPLSPQSALMDPTSPFVTPMVGWQDFNTGFPSTGLGNYLWLLPVDGALVLGSMVNGTGVSSFTIPTSWLFAYLDGLGVQTGQQAGTGWSAEPSPLPNPAQAGYAAGSVAVSFGAVIQNTSDPFLTLDPTTHVGSVVVNQFGAAITDSAASVLPFHAEMQYAPLYLTLR